VNHRALLALLIGCAGSKAAPATPPPAPSAAPSEPVVATMRLGHFSSRDHAVGLVLQRLDKAARVKLDGTQTVMELDEERTHERSDYFASAHRVVLQAYDDGRVIVFLEGKPIELFRDGDVDPVGGTVLPTPGPCCANAEPVASKDQPPDVKLKLGHYRNASRGIGVVVDRTQHEARVRFDSTKEILHLDPTHGTEGRTDYIRTAHNVVLQVWEDGRVVVYVPGDTSGGIDVRRDADADPL
jgi:hypothetical protein